MKSVKSGSTWRVSRKTCKSNNILRRLEVPAGEHQGEDLVQEDHGEGNKVFRIMHLLTLSPTDLPLS